MMGLMDDGKRVASHRRGPSRRQRVHFTQGVTALLVGGAKRGGRSALVEFAYLCFFASLSA